MKILKGSTYRGLKADEHNLSKVVAENAELKDKVQHLNVARDSWESIAMRQKERIAELESKLFRFSRERDPKTGKFKAPAEA